MKRLLLPLLAVIFLPVAVQANPFNKGEIRGVVCGEEEFFKTLKQNFIQKNLYKQALDINNIGGRLRIFNLKTGMSYEFSNFSESFIPSRDVEDALKDFTGNWVATTFKPRGIRKKDNIILKILAYQNGKLKTDYDYKEIFNLKNMTLKSKYERKNFLDMTCEYIPIPKYQN